MNSIQSLPFSFFFIDDLLPDCFGQKKGMTFRSLLTNEPMTNKITYEGIRQDFQNLHAEFEAFDNFYKKIQTITNRDDFLAQQIIGRNKKMHARGNNGFEFVFSQDGRMDVSIIQVDGIKCVLILDVRISRHYDKSDNVIHLKNEMLATRISSALDERRIHKTKSMAEADAAFKNGLIAYQNEILQSINTNEAKFEILLNTLDSLIFSNRGIEAKKSIFFDKLFDITQELSTSEQKKFEEFIEQQLVNNNIKQHHKELLEKLWYANSFDENEKNDLTTCFNKIKIAKTFAWSFLNQATDMLENDTFDPKSVMDMYRIFNKIPTSYLYVLKDEMNDIDAGTTNISDISTLATQNQMALFLDRLIHLKTRNLKNIYPRFKQLCEDCYKGKIESLESPIEKTMDTTNPLNDILYISLNNLSTDQSIDTVAQALMHIIIKENPSMRSLIDTPQNENILNNPDTFGYHWFNDSVNNETILETIDRLILSPNKHLKTTLFEKYPFLTNYIIQSRQNKGIPNQKLHAIYTALKKYTAEEEFDDIYNGLKTLSSNERNILQTYFLSERAKTPEDIDIGGYILGSFELIDLENYQKQKQSKKTKEKNITTVADDEKSANKQLRQHFVEAFNAFLSDIDNDDKKQTMEHALNNLTPAVLNGLKTLPKNDIMGIFIRNYLSEKDKNPSAFNMALTPVILNVRETKNSQLFKAIQEFFKNPNHFQNNQKLQKICSVLSQSDLVFAMDKVKENPTFYEKEELFVKLYYQHMDEDFSTITNIIKQEHTLLLAHKREKRIAQFETALNVCLLSSDTKATEYLIMACQNLSRDDIKFALSGRDITIPGKILLQKITNIIGQNTPTQSEKIKGHINSVRQMTKFQNAFAAFVGDYNNIARQRSLIENYLQVPASDVEIFVNLNRDTPFCTTFFEKLLKNKRRYNDPVQQQDGAVKIVKSTVKKLRFHDVISAFLNQTHKKAAKQLAEQFLTLSQDGPEELSEIMSENENNLLPHFFLREMKDKLKEADAGHEKQTLQDFLTDKDWMIDFYRTTKAMTDKYHQAGQAYKNNPTSQNLEEIGIIRHLAKLHIMSLSLEKTSDILFAKLFEENSMISNEIIKHGFCQSVLNHKDNPSEKTFYLAVIAFCIGMNDNHYEEILHEQGHTGPIGEMIHNLRQFFKNDSFDRVKRKLGHAEFIERTGEFLITQAKPFIKDLVAFRQHLRE